MKKIIYISYNGILEPLGQSQVLNYLINLNNKYNFFLLSFEKSNDYNNYIKLKKFKKICNANSINWSFFRYKYNKIFIEPIIGIVKIIFFLIKKSIFKKIKIVHCRSYIPAFSAIIFKKFYKIKIIFDMRAFWPEEMVSSNIIKSNSIIYIILKYIEKIIIKNSDVIIVLTYASKEYLINNYKINKRIQVIPTCVDLNLFKISQSKLNKIKTFGIIGTITNNWFMLDKALILFREYEFKYSNVILKIITNDNHNLIKKKIISLNIDISKVTILKSEFSDMPKLMNDIDILILFFIGGLSKLASSPTRMGEALAMHIPCIVNKGLGDMSSIVNKYNCGISLDKLDNENIKKSLSKIYNINNNINYFKNARLAAESYFSLDLATEKYQDIYEDLLK